MTPQLTRRLTRQVAACFLFLVCWVYMEVRLPVLVSAELAVRDMPAGAPLRILHLSDVHDLPPPGPGSFRDALLAVKVDAAVITGDLLDRAAADLPGSLGWAVLLKQVAGTVYFTPGNHEHWTGRLPELEAGLRARGVVVLRNASQPLPGHPGVTMVGVDDAYTGRDDVKRATQGLDPAGLAICFTHAPELVDRMGDAPLDLVLAGHTHGGQVRVPGIGSLWAPGQGLLPHWDKGAYALSAGRTLYIDSGYGTSIAPLRLFDRAQASLLTVSRAN